ncbi:MAG: HK97 family phage prohead protease [Alphaproteobacteria bacterium]|nr:HK97 family phage prohead protease [Alphaproteobacteria bacterium]
MYKEKRAFAENIEVRSKKGESVKAGGYAAKFNVLSEDLGGFRERIMPGAFDDVLDDDVVVLFNHDQNLILGRTSAGTARINQDGTGLFYEFDMPNSPLGQNLTESLERGDVKQSSFAFSMRAGEERWIEDANGAIIREIVKISRMFDVSPVVTPAYPDATVAKRSLEEMQAAKVEKNDEAIRACQDLANAKLRILDLREHD